MIRLTKHVLQRQFPQWERSSQVAFVLGILLMIGLLILSGIVPEDQRAFALVAAGGVLLAVQAVVMWANRGMITPYAQAQKHYMAEAYPEARAILETLAEAETPDMRTLTLLGNTYRQLGLLSESKQTLTKALQLAPNHQFPLYGLGRTLLIEGDYQGAASTLAHTIEAGAPAPMRVDLAEAYYRIGDHQAAAALLETLDQQRNMLEDDPQRLLWVDYLRFRLGGEPPYARIIATGLPYWQKTAQHFSQTPYGADLMQDIVILQQLEKGGA